MTTTHDWDWPTQKVLQMKSNKNTTSWPRSTILTPRTSHPKKTMKSSKRSTRPMRSWAIVSCDNNMTKPGRIISKVANLTSPTSTIKQEPSGNNKKTMIIFRKKWGVTRESNRTFTSTMSSTPEEPIKNTMSKTLNRLARTSNNDPSSALVQVKKVAASKIKALIWVSLTSFSAFLL